MHEGKWEHMVPSRALAVTTTRILSSPTSMECVCVGGGYTQELIKCSGRIILEAITNL